MQRNSARYARRFVKPVVMNVPNMKRSIVSNARKHVTRALKNAGTWQRNEYPPWAQVLKHLHSMTPAISSV
jgi:hypothetical protein